MEDNLTPMEELILCFDQMKGHAIEDGSKQGESLALVLSNLQRIIKDRGFIAKEKNAIMLAFSGGRHSEIQTGHDYYNQVYFKNKKAQS